MTPARSEPSFESSLLLKPVETLILTMLTAGERHGYGIRKDILDHSEGRIELEAGGLYRHIRRLESDGLIEPASTRRAAGEDPRRIHYKLTTAGKRVLAAEMLRMRELVRLAEARRIIAPVRT
jgi:DNA-binding PadR family transcriptional regulator